MSCYDENYEDTTTHGRCIEEDRKNHYNSNNNNAATTTTMTTTTTTTTLPPPSSVILQQGTTFVSPEEGDDNENDEEEEEEDDAVQFPFSMIPPSSSQSSDTIFFQKDSIPTGGGGGGGAGGSSSSSSSSSTATSHSASSGSVIAGARTSSWIANDVSLPSWPIHIMPTPLQCDQNSRTVTTSDHNYTYSPQQQQQHHQQSQQRSQGLLENEIPTIQDSQQPQQQSLLSYSNTQHPDTSIAGSVLMLDSQYLDTAASMIKFFESSSTTSVPSKESSILATATTTTEPSQPQPSNNEASVSLPPLFSVMSKSTSIVTNYKSENHDFSILLDQADNKNGWQPISVDDHRDHQYLHNSSPNIALPIVSEEETDSDENVTADSTKQSLKVVGDSDATSISHHSSIVILESIDHPIITSDHYSNNLSNPHVRRSQTLSRSVAAAASMRGGRRLSELVGASVHMMSNDMFTVSIDVHVATGVLNDGMIIDPLDGSTMNRSDITEQQLQQQRQLIMKENILDIISNPDLLRLWCDSIPSTPQQSLIIIRSSEGARNAIHRTQEENATREYEGEWIEAICPQGFVIPSTSKSTSNTLMSSSTRSLSAMGRIFYQIAAFMTGAVGCPANSGAVSMFVERSIGQVSITLSPFPGNIQVCHRIKVIALANHSSKIRIEDTVRIRYDDERLPSNNIFSCCDAIWGCFLPSIDDHVDQVLSSMARLRFLIENGEDGICNDADHRNVNDINDVTHGGDETLVLSNWIGTPQLSSNGGANNITNPLLTRLL